MPRTVDIPKFKTGTVDEINPAHEKLVDYLKRLVNMSETMMASRWQAWQETDRRHRTFVDVAEIDKITGKSRRPHDVKLILPLSYAIHHSVLTYLYTVFTAKEPLIALEGRKVDDLRAARLMEEVLDYDIQRQQGRLMLYAWLNDALRYGLGIVQDEWYEDHARKTVRTREPIEAFGIPMGTRTKEEKKWVRTYNGNRTFNIDPYLYLPDPRVPAGRVQHGDFVGYAWFRSWVSLKQSERSGKYQNVDDVTPVSREKATSASPFNQSARFTSLGFPTLWDYSIGDEDKGFVFGHTVWCKIVPSEFELGGDDPEMWVITLANYDTVLRAEVWDYDSGEFPISVLEPHYDGYSPMNLGITEVVQPMTDMMDWLVGCHDDQTEILTSRGWVSFPDLGKEDQVATMDPATRAWWYEKPKRIMQGVHNGPMVHFHSSRMDAVVTPEHRMWASRQVNRKHEAYEPCGFVEARDVFSETRSVNRQWQMWATVGVHVPQVSGGALSALVLDAQLPKRDRGHTPKYPTVEISADLLAEFIGWYVSEGSVSGTAVSIKQKKPSGIRVIDQMMGAWPDHVARYVASDGAVQWTVKDKRFAAWVSEHCGVGSRNKRLPEMVWAWPRALQRKVLEAAILGDGTHWDRPAAKNCYRYNSLSKILADDVQRLAIGLGWRASVVSDEYTDRDTVWRVNMSTSGSRVTLQRRNVDVVQYSGMVYCVENSTHLIVTRRNGHVLVGGQSHLDNVKKALNDMFVLDPSRINLDDLQRPGPAKWIRLRENAWGQDVKTAITQFPVQDVTRQHVQDIQYWTEVVLRGTGAVDSMLGMQPRQKQQATVFSGMVQMSAARHKVTAQILSEMGVLPWARRQVSNLQQFLDEDTFIKVTGNKAKELGVNPNEFLRVPPENIQGQFDFPVHTGEIPPDPQRNVQVWTQVLMAIAKTPNLAARFDLVEVFKQLVYSAGIKNIDAFLVKSQVMPDEQVMAMRQQGNVVPAQEALAQGNGGNMPQLPPGGVGAMLTGMQ